MRSRTAVRLAWSAWTLTVLFTGGAVYVAVRNMATLGGPGRTAALSVLGGLWTLSFASVGAIVAARRPTNLIGWTFCAMGLVMALEGLAEEYATYGLVTSAGTVPWARVAAWFQNWAGHLVFPSLLVVLVVLFPDGRLPSRRWRPLLVASTAVAVVAISAAMADPRPVQSWLRLEPLRTSNLTGQPALGAVPEWILGAGYLAWAVLFATAAVAPFRRLRRARGDERQQILWFVFAGALLTLTGSFAVVGDSLGAPFWVNYAISVGQIGLAVATGVAILKYRLYDIDRIINRTLVYGLLTIVLGGLYVGLAVGLGSVVGSDNSLVIAGSTLVVAALFRPVRRRIQGFIDRRFYRRKYDAVRTLEAFTARLRDEVDLDELRVQVEAVVRETMQPAQASLWLRPVRRAQ